MSNTSFDLGGKFVKQLKAYLAGIGYNENRDYVDAPHSVSLAASGKHEMVFNDIKAGADARLRWVKLSEAGFKEAS